MNSIMSFQDIVYIWFAVIVVAYISGWVGHIMGPRRNLSGVSYHALLILPQSVLWGERGGAPGPRLGGTWPTHHGRVPPNCHHQPMIAASSNLRT